MSAMQIGQWITHLGALVCAANGRDLSAEDQRQQVEAAHVRLYTELRRMDDVQADLLEALESADSQMQMAYECVEAGRYDEAILHLGSMSRIRRAAIARARGEK